MTATSVDVLVLGYDNGKNESASQRNTAVTNRLKFIVGPFSTNDSSLLHLTFNL